MKSMAKFSIIKIVMAFVALVVFSGCVSTATTQSPPPMTKRTGVAPTAAMLPVGNTNDPQIADYVTTYTAKCLQDRNVFSFVSKEKVDQVVARSGFDMCKTFGLNDEEYKTLASELKVDYVWHGYITVRKELTFSGWRKDVDVFLKLHDRSSGKKVESWRSMTDFTWAKSGTATDSKKMAESAANHICGKIMESR